MQNSNPLHSNYFAKKDMEWHNLVSILSFDFYGPSCQYLQRMGMSSFFGLTLFFFSPLPPFLKNPHTNCTPNSYFIEWTKWSASQLSQVSYHWASNGGFKVDLMNRSKSFDENIVCLVHFVFTPICRAFLHVCNPCIHQHKLHVYGNVCVCAIEFWNQCACTWDRHMLTCSISTYLRIRIHI